jgi:hypothetical protein
MPMGPSVGGLAYFAGVKLVGYTGYAYVLRKKIFDTDPNGGLSRTVKIGATRTGIGLVAGMAYGGLALLTVGIFGEGASSGVYYMLGLLPIRFLEWWLLLWIFFRTQIGDRGKVASGIGLGIVVSYVLDAIGISAALVLPGGVWVC